MTRMFLKGQLDIDYYTNLFVNTIRKGESLIIPVSPELRGFGKTSILNDVSTILQTTYGMDVYVITPHIRTPYVACGMFSPNIDCGKPEVFTWSTLKPNIAVIIDDLTWTHTSQGSAKRIIQELETARIPTVGFVLD